MNDMYDKLGERGVELRRQNKERLAALEDRGHERRVRMAQVPSITLRSTGEIEIHGLTMREMYDA